MKKYFSILWVVILLFIFACKEKPKITEEVRYAKYPVGVFATNKLKKAITYLSKGEKVFKVNNPAPESKDSKTTETQKNTEGKEYIMVRLVDDQKGFMEPKHLSGEPLVITAETDIFQRPSLDSRKISTIKAGNIVFTEEVKGNWIKIYGGRVDGKWIQDYWINSGFSADKDLLVVAKDFEKAVGEFNKDNTDEDAKLKIREIAATNPVFEAAANAMLGGDSSMSHPESEPVTDQPQVDPDP